MNITGTFLFYNFGAGAPLILEFMRDGRLKVTGSKRTKEGTDITNVVYMDYKTSQDFLTDLVTVAYEDYEVNEERNENCLTV